MNQKTHVNTQSNPRSIQKIDINSPELARSESVRFKGVVTEKLPSAEFMVRLTAFPDGSPVPTEPEVRIKCALIGKIKNKIRIMIYDTVTVAISMDTALNKQGTIVYRERKVRPVI